MEILYQVSSNKKKKKSVIVVKMWENKIVFSKIYQHNL